MNLKGSSDTRRPMAMAPAGGRRGVLSAIKWTAERGCRFNRIRLAAAVAVLLAVTSGGAFGANYYAVATNVDLAKNLNATATGGNNPNQPLRWAGGGNGQTDFASPTPGATWQVDLGSTESIAQVSIGAFYSVYDATNYSIQYSTNNVDWIVATNAVGKALSDPYVANLNGSLARYVKLVGTAFSGTAQWSIQNAHIHNAAPSLEIRGSYTLAGQKSNNAYPALVGIPGSEAAAPDLNDEKPSTFVGVGTQAAMPRSLILRLQRTYMLRSVRWQTYGAGWSNPTSYTIAASTDGITWTQVYTTNGIPSADSRLTVFTGEYGTKGIVADRVRLIVNAIGGGADGLYVLELEVFGDDLPPLPRGTLVLLR